jgi:hypothetical protein
MKLSYDNIMSTKKVFEVIIIIFVLNIVSIIL